MRITNKHNLPNALVRAIQNDPYQRGDCDYTVTELISPPRQRRLKELHADEIEEDASDRIWALLGQSVHAVLERADEGMAEERLYMDIEGVTIGGAYDTISIATDTLSDYKLTSVWSVLDGPKPEWITQLNYLRLLAFKQGYKIDELQIVAILRDWSKLRAKREKDYPQAGVVTIPVPVWSIAETIEHMKVSILRHQEAKKRLPLCTAEERWQRETIYAVKKPGRKSAMPGGLHGSMQEASGHAATIKGGYVEIRPGECVRCAHYCSVAPFCSQHQGETS